MILPMYMQDIIWYTANGDPKKRTQSQSSHQARSRMVRPHVTKATIGSWVNIPMLYFTRLTQSLICPGLCRQWMTMIPMLSKNWNNTRVKTMALILWRECIIFPGEVAVQPTPKAERWGIMLDSTSRVLFGLVLPIERNRQTATPLVIQWIYQNLRWDQR